MLTYHAEMLLQKIANEVLCTGTQHSPQLGCRLQRLRPDPCRKPPVGRPVSTALLVSQLLPSHFLGLTGLLSLKAACPHPTLAGEMPAEEV